MYGTAYTVAGGAGTVSPSQSGDEVSNVAEGVGGTGAAAGSQNAEVCYTSKAGGCAVTGHGPYT